MRTHPAFLPALDVPRRHHAVSSAASDGTASSRVGTSWSASPAESSVDGGGVAQGVRRAQRQVEAAGRLTPQQLQQLMDLAVQRPENQWPISRDISAGRNKHRTNTFGEIRDGLVGPYDWFESDVRMQDGLPVAAHDAGNRDGLTMAEWVQVGAASGRGLKFDFKEARAIAPVVQLIHQAGVPDERLLWNVTILDRNPATNASLEMMLELRREFPRSIINLSIGVAPYDDRTIQRAVEVAHQVGGPIMFPLNAAYVTPDVVAKFHLGGRVAIWNSPVQYNPTNIPADTAKFRSWGVDGMIDLLSTHFSAGEGDNINGHIAVRQAHSHH